MDHLLTDEQKTIKELVRTIATEQIVPVRAEFDQSGEFPWGVMKHLADTDMFRIFIPEEYEGLGGGCLDLCLVIEELSRACAGIALCYAASSLGSIAIVKYASHEQKQKYLPDIAAGRKLAALSVTEETAGSDVGGLKTTAKKVDGGYLLNGTKQFVSNGGEAAVYTVIALTDKSKGPRGASAFIVEKDTPGFTFGRKENKMGIRASATRQLIFEDCFVPDENLIGREGMGFMYVLGIFDESRPGIGAQAVGIAQGALDAAIDYAKQRIQFDHPIIAIQAVQHMLADMAIQVEAARALNYAVARAVDKGEEKHHSAESAMTKVFASDVAMRVTTDAVQIFGGSGYMKDYPVEKMMRDAKITQIYEGANQVLRNTIAAELRKRRIL